jgi:hypothetical protein
MIHVIRCGTVAAFAVMLAGVCASAPAQQAGNSEFRRWIDRPFDPPFASAQSSLAPLDDDEIEWHGFQPNRMMRRPPPLDLYAMQHLGGGMLPPMLPQTPGSGAWQLIGPGALGNAYDGGTVSGRIASIAADPKDANTLYISAAGGGVWKTTNGGTSWSPLTDDQAVLAMGSIAVDPTNSSIIYAGTGEPNFSGDSFYGYGILKSTDGGATWTNVGPTEFAQSRLATAKIVIDGTDSTGDTVYATGVSAVNGYYGGFGVYKTTDGGVSWTNTTNSLTSSPICDLVIDPTNAQILYAAVGDTGGESDSGIYKTTNGGASWALAGNYPKGAANGRTALAISTTSHLEVFALVENPSTGGLKYIQKSTDGGATWSAVSTGSIGNFLSGQGWYDLAIAIDPKNANNVYAAGDHYGGTNIILSTNAGASWTDISNYGPSGPHSDEHALAFDAAGKLLSGSDGGIWRLASTSPVTWTNLNGNLATIQLEGIALHPTDSTIAYGGSQDNGTEKYSGSVAWSEVRGGDGGITRVDQTNPNTVYHEYYSVSIERSDDGGNTWNGITSGIAGNSVNFYAPYVLDPANSSRVLYGTDYLNESTNKGGSWSTIGKAGTAGFNTTDQNIDSIGVYGQTIYVTCGSNIYVTFNDGATWANVSNPSISSSWDWYSDIAIDSTNTKRAFLVRPVFDNYGSSSVGHVFMTTNGGTSWSDITGNLADIPVNAVRFDPAASVLYVGTDAGVYSSTDLGSGWALFGSGLPNARVIALELNTTLGILAAGTHGRSLWEISTRSASAPTISKVSPSTIHAGGGNITLTVAGSNFVSGAKVTWNGSNLTTTFASSSKLTAVVPAADHSVAGTATVQVVNPGGTGSNKVTVTITTSVASVSVKPNPVVGSTAATGTVTLTNTLSTSSTVALSSSNTAVATVPTSVTVPAGSKTATFTVNTSAVSAAGKSTIKASFSGSTASTALTVAPIGVASVKLSSSSVTGSASVTATVTLQAKAAPGAISVTASSSNTGVATVSPATFTIAAGAQTGTFTVKTSAVTTATKITIKAVANGKSATATLTVNP